MNSCPGRDAVVDLGKTSCRLRVGTATVTVPGAGGLAEHDGVDRALTSILAAYRSLDDGLARRIGSIAVGAAGAMSDPTAAARLADDLARALGADVAVTSDAVSAHAGALDGAPGTVLVVGTGAVALGIAADGTTTRSDGAGVWLGDEGSGRWIGQRGLRAAVRATDGRGPGTSLTDDAARLAGSVAALPAWVGGGTAPERRLAAFAPTVLAAATAGDPVAAAIRADAVVELVCTGCAAAPAGSPAVAVLGGLVGDDDLRRLLTAALADAGLRVVEPVGDALDGAARIAADPALPHERQVTRVRGTRAA